MSARGLDPIGWFIATTHQLLDHAKTAALCGQQYQPGDEAVCPICIYERERTDETKQAVIDWLGVPL